MTEEELAALAAHLVTLEPIVKTFCDEHGYRRSVGSSVGRYPRIRLERFDQITRWIDLWMCVDEDGQRYTSFEPSLPYELSGGACLDEPETRPGAWRYSRCFVVWPSLPFNQVAQKLPLGLRSAVARMEDWNEETLKSDGQRVRLG